MPLLLVFGFSLNRKLWHSLDLSMNNKKRKNKQKKSLQYISAMKDSVVLFRASNT